MHVLIAALSRFDSPTGICRHAANLAASLANRSEVEQITFVTGAWQGYYRDLLGAGHAKIRPVAIELKNSSASRNRWFLLGLPSLAKSIQADIVHLSFPLPINKSRSVYKTVVTLHDLYPYDCPEVFGYPNVYFNRLFLRNCLKNADGIACVSNSTHSRLRALFSKSELDKSRVIPNIVRQDVYGSTRPMGWPDSPFVLVVAQHRPNKNVELAAKGFAELRARGIVPRETRLVIVGTTGPSTESIEHEITRLGIERESVFLSAIPESKLQWLYANCSLFLVTSTVEGFCLPLVEALRRSARVVCSDIPSLREVGGDSCEYFALNEFPSQSLVEAASRALVSRHENSSDLERFSSDKVGAAYVRFYRDLATGDRMPEVALSV